MDKQDAELPVPADLQTTSGLRDHKFADRAPQDRRQCALVAASIQG